MKKYLFVLLFALILILPTTNSILIESNGPSPPGQPASGPGGSDYQHEAVKKSRYKYCAKQYWIFEPTDPTPESGPLIAFIHGYSAIFPFYYRAWINHLVRKGNIVVYPRYQFGLYLGYRKFYDNAINAVKDAIIELSTGEHVQPELEKFAITGHSFGGGITTYMASKAQEVGLPIPKAIMPVQPYLSPIHTIDFNKISNETLMIVLVGENDTTAGSSYGLTIFENATQIPYSQKDFVIQVTDTYGDPDLLANHRAPVCIPWKFTQTVDAMDYYSTWKLFDALTDYAFYGINGEYCLGNTTEQRFMGLWSDGTPVKEMIVTDNP